MLSATAIAEQTIARDSGQSVCAYWSNSREYAARLSSAPTGTFVAEKRGGGRDRVNKRLAQQDSVK